MRRHTVQTAETAGMAASYVGQQRPADALRHRHRLHSARSRIPHHGQQRAYISLSYVLTGGAQIAQSLAHWTLTRESRVGLPAAAVCVAILSKPLIRSCFGPLS